MLKIAVHVAAIHQFPHYKSQRVPLVQLVQPPGETPTFNKLTSSRLRFEKAYALGSLPALPLLFSARNFLLRDTGLGWDMFTAVKLTTIYG